MFMNAFRMTFIFIALMAALMTRAAEERRVVGEGRAPIEDRNARQRALTEALRDAVRKGVGVDMISTSRVRNFILEDDAISSSAFGYVKDYRVVSAQDTGDGLLTLNVEATVGRGQPGRDEFLALRHIIVTLGEPRVAIECDESFKGINARRPVALSVLKEMALEYGMNVVDANEQRAAESSRARRDQLLGAARNANYRKSGIKINYDFLIKATINADYKGQGRHTSADILTHEISLSVDLKAMDAEGRVIAMTAFPSLTLVSAKGSPEQACRDILKRLLEGKIPASRGVSAVTFFKRIIGAWMDELDRGALVTLEARGIDRRSFERLLAGLRQVPGITDAFEREFDARLTSVIEIRSRLDMTSLMNEARRCLGPGFQVDRMTRNFLAFAPVSTSVPPATGAKPSPKKGASSSPARTN